MPRSNGIDAYGDCDGDGCRVRTPRRQWADQPAGRQPRLGVSRGRDTARGPIASPKSRPMFSVPAGDRNQPAIRALSSVRSPTNAGSRSCAVASTKASSTTRWARILALDGAEARCRADLHAGTRCSRHRYAERHRGVAMLMANPVLRLGAHGCRRRRANPMSYHTDRFGRTTTH
jgi:hypothetical protein